MAYIDSDVFRTVATKNLEPEYAKNIEWAIKSISKSAVTLIEEGYETPYGSNNWKILAKLQNGNYCFAAIPNQRTAKGAKLTVGSVPLTSDYLASLRTFIAFLHADEQEEIIPYMKDWEEFGMTDHIAFAQKRDKRQQSYRQHILSTGNPRAAQVQRALQDGAAKIITPEDGS